MGYLALTKPKINKMFKLILLLDSDKLVANRLNIGLLCFRRYISEGKEIETKFEKLLELHGFYSYDISDKLDDFENLKFEYERQFMEENDLEKLDYYSRRQFKHYLKYQEAVYLEEIVSDIEWNILKNITFSKNNDVLNSNIKIYIHFYRTYMRAKCALEEDYLAKLKEVITDAKNIRSLEKRLAKLDKEEFQDEVPDKTVNNNYNFTILDGLLQYEKNKTLPNPNVPRLTDESNIIDVEYEVDKNKDEEYDL